MGKQARLLNRDGKWTFRARVPADVQAVIGKKQIWKSLGDVSHAEAVRLVRIESVRVDELFADARKRAAPSVAAELTDAQIEQVARGVLYEMEAAASPMPFDEREREERLESALEDAAMTGQTIEDAGLQRLTLRVAEKERLGVDRTSRTFPRLVEAVQRALIESYLRDADRAALKRETVHDSLFEGVSKGSPPPAKALTLSRAVELYVGDVERATVAPKTRAAYGFKFAALQDLLGGERAVSEISRADIREMRDVLLTLPSNATKRFPGQSLRKVAEMAAANGIAPMSPKSVTMYVETISALFKWLVREELLARNLAEGLKGPAIPEQTDRRPFTVDELNRLFSADAFSGRANKGWQYWLPRIALFSGARFAEILGLKAGDVVEHDGVAVFRLEPNDVRGLKTRTSRRLVPIHPELIRLGLVRHAAGLPQDGFLFPDAIGPKDMVTACNKTMGKAIRAIIPDPNVVFHSMRHTFKDAAERADIPREHIASIGGWDLPNGKVSMDSYGRAKHSAKLAAEIAKVKFDGLSL